MNTEGILERSQLRGKALHKYIFSKTQESFLAPIADLLADESISEIMINGYDTIYIERGGKVEKTPHQFRSEEALLSAIKNIAQACNRTVTDHTVRVDAYLDDGSRVHVVFPPAATNGITVAIRRFRKSKATLDDYIEWEVLCPETREFLELCVLLNKNVIVSGGTGTGKTTFLNALSSVIPSEQRIIVIEDNTELQLQQEHVLQLEAQTGDIDGQGKATIQELFHSCLRLRPDRVVVGECRGGEALDMIQAMTSGHRGSMSTLHASNPVQSLRRLETMMMQSGYDIPQHVIRAQIASAIDIVVQLVRFHDTGERKITDISEVHPDLDQRDEYQINQLYDYDYKTGKLRSSGKYPYDRQEPQNLGLAKYINHTAHLWQP